MTTERLLSFLSQRTEDPLGCTARPTPRSEIAKPFPEAIMQHVNHFISLPLDLHTELCGPAKHRGVSITDILVKSILNTAEEYRFELEEFKLLSPFGQQPELRFA